MRVNYDGEQVDEEYEVCFDDEDGYSSLHPTEVEAMKLIRDFEYPGGPIASLYLLQTFYDALGDKGLTKAKLIYRTGDQQDE